MTSDSSATCWTLGFQNYGIGRPKRMWLFINIWNVIGNVDVSVEVYGGCRSWKLHQGFYLVTPPSTLVISRRLCPYRCRCRLYVCVKLICFEIVSAWGLRGNGSLVLVLNVLVIWKEFQLHHGVQASHGRKAGFRRFPVWWNSHTHCQSNSQSLDPDTFKGRSSTWHVKTPVPS